MYVVEHNIQRKILRELVKEESRRFSDIKPKNIESNLFMYHLRQLTGAGLVDKLNNGLYSLTTEGRQYCDRSNLDSMSLRLQPKQITVLVVSNGEDKFLVLKRLHVPYMNYTGFPSGKIHYGEKMGDSAHRELHEKTGLENMRLTLRGNLMMRFLDKETDEIVSHVNAYVFSGVLKDKYSTYKSEFFETYLQTKDKLFGKRVFKGHKEILENLEKSKNYFFEDCLFESDF